MVQQPQAMSALRGQANRLTYPNLVVELTDYNRMKTQSPETNEANSKTEEKNFQHTKLPSSSFWYVWRENHFDPVNQFFVFLIDAALNLMNLVIGPCTDKL